MVKGMGYAQIVLMTVILVCLAFNQALVERNVATRTRLMPVMKDLKELERQNAISSNKLHAITDQLHPLMLPTLYDPWLLRNVIPIGSGCIMLNSLLLLLCLRWKSQTTLQKTGDNQETVNG